MDAQNGYDIKNGTKTSKQSNKNQQIANLVLFGKSTEKQTKQIAIYRYINYMKFRPQTDAIAALVTIKLGTFKESYVNYIAL